MAQTTIGGIVQAMKPTMKIFSASAPVSWDRRELPGLMPTMATKTARPRSSRTLRAAVGVLPKKRRREAIEETRTLFAAAQVTYNMLNPSAAGELPAGYPAQDYSRLLDRTQAAGIGVVGIRVLAGGALSGSAERHPIASPPPEPIGSALTYAADLARARRLRPLLDEGHAVSLPEAAIRFAMAHPAVSTLLVGMAAEAEFEQALAAIRRGPLPPEALERLAALQRTFVGEAR